MLNRLPMLLTSVAFGITFAGAALMLLGSEANAKPVAITSVPPRLVAPTNAELNTLYLKALRKEALTPEAVNHAIAKVRQLQAENQLRSGADYFVATVIAARGQGVNDASLAHDLAICALTLGDSRAAPWAAVTQDQLMIRLNQKQRFGTQVKNGQLAPVAPDVADAMRLIVGLPSLIVAKQKAEAGQSLDPVAKPALPKLVPVPDMSVATAE